MRTLRLAPTGVVKDADGITGETEAVETKCLSAAHHIEAYITKAIPEEYHYQMLQYFIVNDKLQQLHFCFFDPRIPTREFFYLTINRADVEVEARANLAQEITQLAEVDGWVEKLSQPE